MNIFHNDAYQLSMLYAHWKSGRVSVQATAEAFFRTAPKVKGPVIMAGAYRINEMLNSNEFMKNPFGFRDMAYIQNHILKVSDEDFSGFQSYLLDEFPSELQNAQIRYAQDGEVLYPEFPAVQVSGSLGAIHMLETPILSILNSSVRAATLARAIRTVAGDRVKLLDFSSRRQDDEAAVHTAVAAVIGGFDGTSNLEAGRIYHVPTSGTMAHSYVLSYGMNGELAAFKDFLRAYPNTHVLLVDTFDTMKGLGNAIRASFETSIPLRAVRLDSAANGNWASLISSARELLDVMGCVDTKIVVSGDYNEDLIRSLQHSSTSAFHFIDVIGIGSRLGSPDFSMGFVYKLVEVEGEPVRKLGGKGSLPFKKVWLHCRTGNHLIFASDNWVVSDIERVVLQLDNGEVPVNLEYLQAARQHTARVLVSPTTCFPDVVVAAARELPR